MTCRPPSQSQEANLKTFCAAACAALFLFSAKVCGHGTTIGTTDRVLNQAERNFSTTNAFDLVNDDGKVWFRQKKGRSTTYYFSLGRRINAVVSSGEVWTYHYENNLLVKKSSNGKVVAFAWSFGRLEAIQNNLGSDLRPAYGLRGGMSALWQETKWLNFGHFVVHSCN